MRRRIAIVGGGVAGLTAGYLLSRRYEVFLFERSHRIGGNAYTYLTSRGEEVELAAATFGRRGYPNFFRLLSHLGVATRRALTRYVTIHDLDRGRGMCLTPHPREILPLVRPAVLETLLRFLRGIEQGRHRSYPPAFTVREALERLPQLSGDARILFLCLLCLLSSMSASEILEAPARFFFGKLTAYGDILPPHAFTSWRAIRGRTRRYVEALAAPFGDRISIGARIETILRRGGRVTLVFAGGRTESFDGLVLACHADEALRLLRTPTEEERALLGAWRYKDGRLVLHRDHASFPPWDRLQPYTFLYTDRAGRFDTSVNGVVRHLEGVSKDCDLVASQHPNFPIRGDRIEFETVLRTPIFDIPACRTIPFLPRLNGTENTYYCGSYFGYGLHEDAVRSAVAVAEELGVPFEPASV